MLIIINFSFFLLFHQINIPVILSKQLSLTATTDFKLYHIEIVLSFKKHTKKRIQIISLPFTRVRLGIH